MSDGVQRILLAVGAADRPDLLDAVSQFLFARGGNIDDTRFIVLGGRASILMTVHISVDDLAKLRADVDAFQTEAQLQLEIHQRGPDVALIAGAFPYRLTAAGPDQPGVISKLSQLLRTLRVDIDDIKATALPADGDLAAVFELHMLMNVPRETPVSMLRDYLTGLLGPMKITWELAQL